MTRPGVPGLWRRRGVAASVAALGLLNITLAAAKHPLIRIGPMHGAIPHTAVVGSRYVLLVAGLVLLTSARGLLHGKRQAWRIALAAAALSLVAHPFKRVDIAGTVATAVVIAVLMSSASLFPARSDPARTRQGWLWLLLGELAVFVYGVVGLYFLDSQFLEPTDFPEAFSNAGRLLFVLPRSTISPVTRHGEWFVDSVRVMAVLVFMVAAWHLLHPVIVRVLPGRAERRRAEALLERYATSSIAYFHLLEDKSYFFEDSGEAFIGYKVVGGTAVALGEPIGELSARREVARSFAEFCDLNGWAFCYHQVSEPGAELLRSIGLNAIKIGEEAVIPVGEFSLAGKSFKHIRNATNRLERDGLTVVELPKPLDRVTLDELEEVSDAWLREGGHRERAFTLGAFDRDYLRETPVFAVRSPTGRIEAFANVIPSYQSNQGNFDLMRRRPDAPDGVMDYLFVYLIGWFRARGFEGMSLGFAPLANIEGSGVVARALRLFYAYGSRAFNFRGLRVFKEKWHPRWEPRYLVYRSELQLPQLALAVARAGEREGHAQWPWLGRRDPSWPGRPFAPA